MKDKIKPDELFDMYFEADGAPMKVGQDPAALAQIRAAKLKQQEAMRKMAMAKEAADGYSKATKAPEPGSPGEQLMNQGGGQ
jgi:hypothetical protein